MFLHITKVTYLGEYKIKLTFNNGREGVADLKDQLHGTMFLPLKEKALFATVRVDSELETITWENGADFAPEFLYYLCFKNDKSEKKQFQQWGYLSVAEKSKTYQP